MEKVNEKYVIYGMGNFLSNQSPESDRTLIRATQDGALFTFSFEERPDGGFRAVKAEFTPAYVHHPDDKIVKVSPSVMADSFARTCKAVNLLGPGTNDATPTTGPLPADAVPQVTTTTKAPTNPKASHPTTTASHM